MTADQAIQYCLSGITSGSIYAIVAIGFNIIYNTTGIINFAQGEFVVIGAMTAITLSARMPLAAAVGLAVLFTALIGGLVEIAFIRCIKRPTVLRLIVITIGLSILLREAVQHVWDEKVHQLPYFSGTDAPSLTIFGAHLSPQVLWVLGTCGAMVAGLIVFFNFTFAGRAMRACSANRAAARLCGIPARRMVTGSFMIAAGLGAVAGCVISPISHTQYDMGAPLAVKGFTVAILGGLGDSLGAVAAGLLLGLLEAFSISVLPGAYQEAIATAVLLLVLFFRPSGLFGNRTAASLKEF